MEAHLLNARAEGIESKWPFRRLLGHQHCINPASAFFEWQAMMPGAQRKVKYRIARRRRAYWHRRPLRCEERPKLRRGR